MEKALSDLRVLEFAHGWPSPVCGRLLSELGAEVIKVEPPSGDKLRNKPPFKEKGISYVFQLTSAGKKSIVLNHETTDCDRKKLRELSKNVDIIIEDFPVGKMENWGLGYKELEKYNPGLIYCSITPFGQTGPLSTKLSCDIVIQAMAGTMATTGFSDDPPTKAGIAFSEYNGALYAMGAILAALAYRDRSGIGQHIDIAEYDCTFLLQNSNLPNFFTTGKCPRIGNSHPLVNPLNSYKAKDGWVFIGASSDKMWHQLLRAIGREDLIDNPDFNNITKRLERREEVDKIINEWTRTKSIKQALNKLEEYGGMSCGPILTVGQLLNDDHFLECNMVIEVEHSIGEKIPTIGSVFKMSATQGSVESAAPLLGEHTEEVLSNPFRSFRQVGTIQKIGERKAASKKLTKPLKHIRIIELAHYTSGPFGTRHLANLGAEVIKVEPPEGEIVRHLSYAFHLNNNDKKGITLNLKAKRDKEILKALVKKSDVLLENFTVGTLKKLGLDYDVLKEYNPALIFCSLTGFGQTGPYRDKPAFDTIIQSMSGLVSLTGWPDGPPVKIGLAASDTIGASFAVPAILAALHYRERTGKGQYIDLSMQNTSAWYTQETWPIYFSTASEPHRYGNRHPMMAPHNSYKAKDGLVVIAVESDENWVSLLRIINREELIHDTRFDSSTKRVLRVEEVDDLVTQWTKHKTVDEIVNLLDNGGVPSGPVMELDEVVKHPQTIHRNMIVELDTSPFGKIKIPGSPFKLSKTPGTVESPAPDLGRHNEEVLCGLLGYSKEKVRQLRIEKQ